MKLNNLLINNVKYKLSNNLSNKLPSIIYEMIKNKLIYEIELIENSDYAQEINKFISKYDKNKNKDFSFRDKNTYCFLTSKYVFFKISKETFVWIEKRESKNDFYIKYKFIGKNYKKIKKYIESIIFNKNRDCNNLLVIYNISYVEPSKNEIDINIKTKELNNRSLDSIYLNNNVLNKIKNHIDGFIKNKSIYKDKNLIYKTGILLEGNPGTGKTSLVTALANEYGMDIVNIDMNSIDKLDLNQITSLINNDNKSYIVLLEDIDCVISHRENLNIDRTDQKNINKLLQFLDSNSSPSNVIFIATTNYPELLDDAIIRSGRFDLKVNIGPIKKDIAIKMCKSFGLDEFEIKKCLKIYASEDNYYNQSKLQEIILLIINERFKEIST